MKIHTHASVTLSELVEPHEWIRELVEVYLVGSEAGDFDLGPADKCLVEQGHLFDWARRYGHPDRCARDREAIELFKSRLMEVPDGVLVSVWD